MFLSGLIEVGAIGSGIIVIVILKQVEFVHPVICEFAQYVVVCVGATIVNGLPVPRLIVPQPVVNHPVIFPEFPDAEKVTFPEKLVHRLFVSAANLVGAGGGGLTVMETERRDALTQAPE